MEQNAEWRVLVNGAPARAIQDPVGAEYSFCIMQGDRIIRREPPRNGFTHDASSRLRELLTAQLAALDKPMLVKVTTTVFREIWE